MSKPKSSLVFNTIEEALEAIKRGELVIVVDDEDRENEGDFVAAAEKVTPEMINFMSTVGKGLICVPLLAERCEALKIRPMVSQTEEAVSDTAFTVSVDKIEGCTTGISASDRYQTVRWLCDDHAKPTDFARPGHIFPLIAQHGGVLRRPGHTEAAIDLARLAGLYPAGLIVEIIKENGEMARLPDLTTIAKKYNLTLISIEDLIAYRLRHESLIECINTFDIRNSYGEFKAHIFKQINNGMVHLALTRGRWTDDDNVTLKVESNIVNLNFFGILSGDSQERLDVVFEQLNQSDKSAFICVNRSIPNEMVQSFFENYKKELPTTSLFNDKLDRGIGTQIIRALRIKKATLISRTKPSKLLGLSSYDLEITGYKIY